jgi:hypothetical protein
MTYADKINNHLRDEGGVVQITSYGRSTLYSRKHIGWFSMDSSNLMVRRGRAKDCLSIGPRLLCAIRFGHEKKI